MNARRGHEEEALWAFPLAEHQLLGSTRAPFLSSAVSVHRTVFPQEQDRQLEQGELAGALGDWFTLKSQRTNFSADNHTEQLRLFLNSDSLTPQNPY